MKYSIRILLFAAIVLNSCGVSRISFNVLAPAPNNIPQEIQSIAIIDRSLPENSDLNKLEGILTGEGLEQDRLSTQFVLDGLNSSLSNTERYVIVRTDETLQGSGSGFLFPKPLLWDKVNSLCEKYDVDAIVSLETYDSDFILTNVAGKGLLNMSGQGLVTVNCGFRMYYPALSVITDEFHFSHEMSWDAGGLSILGAANALLNKNKAIREASHAAGIVYGQRITPTWFLVSREYFKKSKSNPDLDEGARMMQLNDWDKAISSLERALESGKTKDRGRAAHNLAIVYEIQGDLDMAKEWTTVSWGRYGEKKSRNYGYILTRRINDQQTLDYQLEKN